MSAQKAGRRRASDISSEAEHRPYPHRPNGPALAGVVAAALGAFVLGVVTTVGEASASVKDWLIFRDPVGPLSGKTTMSVAAWAVSWVVLGVIWRKRDVSVRIIVIVSAILLGLGVLFTYPTFFEQFASE